VSTRADDAWAAGPPILEKKGPEQDLLRSRRPVDKAKLPPGVASLVGTRVRLLDAHGVRCEATLGELFVRGRAFVGSGEVNEGRDATDPDEGDARTAWGESPHHLVARAVGDAKKCAGATWARAVALPLPPIATAQPPSPELKTRALAALRALPESATIQRDYARWYPSEHPKHRSPPHWLQRHTQQPVIRLFRPASGPALLSVSAMVAEGDCANGVFDAIWGLWEIDDKDPANPRLILRNQPDAQMTLAPTAAVDVDGDGAPELLFDSSSDYATMNAAGQPRPVNDREPPPIKAARSICRRCRPWRWCRSAR